MRKAKYLISLIVPISIYASLVYDRFQFLAVILLFVLIPLLELAVHPDHTNLSLEDENKESKSVFYFLLLVIFFLAQSGAVLVFCVSARSDSAYLFPIHVITMGISCGIMGINVAHELGHRDSWYEKAMSKVLLMTALYMHFYIEHNYGHHQNVSTHDDPASARRGESLYRFYVRSIWMGFRSAWNIEAERLNRKHLNCFSLYNQMLWFLAIQLAFLAAIATFCGISVCLAYMLSALIGILLLETVNYIEHYGLARRKKENGEYERTLPIHSWNSNHIIGRICLFELSRHSDHHYRTNRKYQILRHHAESPQMPTGYPGMMILSLVPPLWFYVLHRRIDNLAQMSTSI